MKTCVLIPTFNEALQIGGLVSKVKAQGLEVIVIDDGSKDNTLRIARQSGAIIISNVHNEGKGSSLNKGFCFALEKGFDAVITMDGDGQHLPEDLPYFIRLAQYSETGVFIGNRMHKPHNMPFVRFVTNKFMSYLLSGITRQRIPDSQCGYRLIKREVLERTKLCARKFETESELLIRAARLGFKIESVPIKTVYNNEKSRINPVLDTFRFFRFIIKELWTTRS